MVVSDIITTFATELRNKNINQLKVYNNMATMNDKCYFITIERDGVTHYLHNNGLFYKSFTSIKKYKNLKCAIRKANELSRYCNAFLYECEEGITTNAERVRF